MIINTFDRRTAYALADLGIDPYTENLIVHVTGLDGRDRQGDSWATVGTVSAVDLRPCVWNLQYRIDTTIRRDVDVYDEGYEDVDICGPLETLAGALREALEAADDETPIELDINYWALALMEVHAA